MASIEISNKDLMSREDAAARLRALSDELAKHNEVEFDRGGMRITVHVPDQVYLKLEVELEDDKHELEVELTW
jgi:amphi-Trp domain-containing protein